MWCISNCSSPFQMQFHFPLNHDYGRKSKGWQKKRVTTMAKNYGKKLHFLHQSLEKQFLEVSIPFRYCFFIVSTSGFTNFKHPNKKKLTTINSWQLVNVSAAENQWRVDSQLKLWWWCSLRIDQGVYHLLNASILWGLTLDIWIKEKGFQKMSASSPKKSVTWNFGVVADFF